MGRLFGGAAALGSAPGLSGPSRSLSRRVSTVPVTMTPVRGGERWEPMSDGRKVMTGVYVIAGAFLLVLVASILALSAAVTTQSRFQADFTRRVLLAEELKADELRQNRLVPIFILAGDASVYDQLTAANRDVRRRLAALAKESLSGQGRSRLDAIARNEAALETFEAPGVDLRRRGASLDVAHRYLRRRAGAISTAVLADIDAFVDLVTTDYQAAQARAVWTFRTVLGVLVLASCATLAFTAVIARLLARLVRQARELEAAREELARREKEVSVARKQAVETVAHDLRSPLTAIVMAADVLRDQPALAQAPRAEVMLNAITAGARAMTRLIADVLDHAKIEAGSLLLEPSEIDLQPLIMALLVRFELIATPKDVAIVSRIGSNLPAVDADTGRMEQVLSNLLGNAVKFTPPGGMVEVTAAEVDGRLVIAVSDTGPGVPPDQLEHLFQRYWQAAATATQGSGLGLAIAKGIVDAHGGTIEVRSRSGHGSTFSISLPLALSRRRTPA